MQTFHYKRLIAGDLAKRLMVEGVKAAGWFGKGCKRGFSIHTADEREIMGAFAWRETVVIPTLDEESLEDRDTTKDVLKKTVFRVLFSKGLIRADSRANLGVLYDIFDEMPGVAIAFEELNLNLEDYTFEVQSAYKRNEIDGVKIRDYLSRDHMLASPTFKILEPVESEKIVEKYSDQLESVKLKFKLPDGVVTATITRKGTLRISDDAPDEMVMFMVDLMPRFDEHEVETAEVVDPKK